MFEVCSKARVKEVKGEEKCKLRGKLSVKLLGLGRRSCEILKKGALLRWRKQWRDRVVLQLSPGVFCRA